MAGSSHPDTAKLMEPGIRVYETLIRICGAPDDDLNWLRWEAWWASDNRHATEYRFIGALGFGGKFWRANGRWYVNCYREHETPDRLAAMIEANHELEDLRACYGN